jgi:hypothetical protein
VGWALGKPGAKLSKQADKCGASDDIDLIQEDDERGGLESGAHLSEPPPQALSRWEGSLRGEC